MNVTANLPPGRREANRQSRREVIIDVARGSFLDHGYAGTTMSGIASQLGGSKGTLWSYFPAKEALFAAVVDRATQEFRRQLTVILNPGDEPEAALRRFCEQFLAKITSHDAIALHRLVIGESSRFPELGRIFYERAPLQTNLLLADFIAGAQDRGLLQGIEPLRAAQHLIWLCMSGSYQMRLTGAIAAIPPDEFAADIDAAMTTFIRAYGFAGHRG
ncbi:MAG: TetR/AcrR family transcriptional regulator C-terminal domain-containing protein [Novosphingobium sp.]